MIYFIVLRRHAYTITTFLEVWGRACADIVKIVPYEELETFDCPPGVWIFCDLDRLSPEMTRQAGQFRQHIAEKGEGCRVLNDPGRSFLRFDLLRTLHEQGINSFNVYRLEKDPRPERYPVFLRRERGHAGPIGPLLNTADEFDAAVGKLNARAGIIAVEFVDVSRDDGCYRKYAAFRIGDRIVPRHIFFSRHWMVKEADLAEPAQIDEELAYLRDNPRAARLFEIFDLARIDYGRIDYGMRGDRMEIWEINTNPMIASAVSRRIPARRVVHEIAARTIMDALRATLPPAAATKRSLWRRLGFGIR